MKKLIPILILPSILLYGCSKPSSDITTPDHFMLVNVISSNNNESVIEILSLDPHKLVVFSLTANEGQCTASTISPVNNELLLDENSGYGSGKSITYGESYRFTFPKCSISSIEVETARGTFKYKY